MKFMSAANPMTGTRVLRYVKALRTPDVHSVSLTGGEPLQAGDFLIEVARKCKSAGFRTYLETGGMSPRVMARVLRYVDIAAIDLKLPEHLAVPPEGWPELLEGELACVRMAVEKGAKTFVKIVALTSTEVKTIGQICKRLTSVARVPLVLQPVTPAWKVRRKPTLDRMFCLSKAAVEAGIEEVAIIPQIHKAIRAI
jgi:organic radical activating enzyme